jgi:hypothetical protein
MAARNTDTRTWRRLIADTIRGAIESQIMATTRALGRPRDGPRSPAKAAPLFEGTTDTRNRDVNDPRGALGSHSRAGGGVVHVSVPLSDALNR